MKPRRKAVRDENIYDFFGTALWGSFIFLTLSGVPVALHFNFLGGDLPLLLSMPLPRTEVFRYKFVETTIANSAIFLFLVVPLIAALCLTIKSSFIYMFITS